MTDKPHRLTGPFFATFRGFQPAWLSADLIAGLTLAAIAIPEQLATAHLASMPPETGFYAFAAGAIAFAVLGANRYLSVGADSTIAPIFVSGVTLAAGRAPLAETYAIVALIAGVTLVAAGILRAGWIADLLSVPVTVGFLSGIAVRIALGQVQFIFGTGPTGSFVLSPLVGVVRDFHTINPVAPVIALVVFAIAMLCERVSPKIPGALIGLVVSGAIVALLPAHGHLDGLVLPRSLPAFSIPHVGWDLFWTLVPTGLIVALVCMMQTAAVARAFPSDRSVPEDVGRDFGAVGAGSILAAFFGSFAVDASPPRTAIVHVSGGKSQLSSLVAVAAMVVLVAFLAGLAGYVTLPALGGILVFIAMRIFRFHTIVKIWRRGGYEVLLTLAAMLAVVLFPVERGMLAAIVLSLVYGLYVVARPPSTELSRITGTTIWWPPSDDEQTERVPGVLVFDPAGPITFTNAQFVTTCLRHLVANASPPVRLIVIDASKVIYLDYTGTRAVRRLFRDFIARGITVAIARLSDQRSQAAVRRSGIVRAIGRDRVFKSVEDAVVALGPEDARRSRLARAHDGLKRVTCARDVFGRDVEVRDRTHEVSPEVTDADTVLFQGPCNGGRRAPARGYVHQHDVGLDGNDQQAGYRCQPRAQIARVAVVVGEPVDVVLEGIDAAGRDDAGLSHRAA